MSSASAIRPMGAESRMNVATSFEERSTLGQDEFLRILITQLQNQDPLQPMQDREFIAQMATFSTLEQMTRINKTFQEMRGIMLGQAVTMVGKEVTYRAIVPDADNPGLLKEELITSRLAGFRNENGTTRLLLDDGNVIQFQDVVQIHTNPSNPVIEYSSLIGKKVTYATTQDGNTMTESAIVKAISAKDGKIQLVLDNEANIGILEVIQVESQ